MSKNLFSKKALAAVLSVGMLTAQAAAVNVFASNGAQASQSQSANNAVEDIWAKLDKIDFTEIEKTLKDESKKEESKLAKAAKWVIGGVAVGAATLAGIYSAVAVGTKFKNKVTLGEAFKNNIITNTASSAANKVKTFGIKTSNKIEDSVKGLFGKKDYVRVEEGKKCPANSTLKEGSTTKCVANEGFELYKDNFVKKCPENIGRDKKTGECTVSLVKNATVKKGKLVCDKENQELVGNNCLDKCSGENKFRLGKYCVKECPNGTTANENVCKLNEGVELKGKKIVCKSKNAELKDKGVCGGKKGYDYQLSNGDFVKACPKGTTAGENKVCKLNEGVKAENGKFVCAVEGAKMDKDGNCGCKKGYEVYRNKCEKACAVSETRNTEGNCELKSELKKGFFGISCKDANATYDKKTGTCAQKNTAKVEVPATENNTTKSGNETKVEIPTTEEK